MLLCTLKSLFILVLYIVFSSCVNLNSQELEQGGNIKIESNGECITTGEIPSNEPIITFNYSQVLSTKGSYPNNMTEIDNIISNKKQEITDLLFLVYNLLYQLDQGNEYYSRYYIDIQKYFNWNKTNWFNYNLTGKYKTIPNEIQAIYDSLINHLKQNNNKETKMAYSKCFFICVFICMV